MTSLHRRRFAAAALTATSTIAAIAAAALAPPAHAQHAHRHGVVALAVAIDGAAVVLQLDAPLDSLIGFERPPRSAAERQAADAMLQRLKSGDGLFAFEPAARCTLQSAAAEAAALAPGAKTGEHADLEARFEYACADAAQLKSIGVGGLLDAFRRIERIDAQVVAPAGQFRRTLKRSDRTLRWGR